VKNDDEFEPGPATGSGASTVDPDSAPTLSDDDEVAARARVTRD